MLEKIKTYAINQMQKKGIKIKETEQNNSQEDKKDTYENSEKMSPRQDLTERFYILVEDLFHYPELPKAVSETIDNIPSWQDSQKFELISKEATKSIQEIKETIKLCHVHHAKVRDGWKAYIHDKQVYISNLGNISFK